jgi:hypothetical protein
VSREKQEDRRQKIGDGRKETGDGERFAAGILNSEY